MTTLLPPLVSPDDLAAALAGRPAGDPGLRVLDASTALDLHGEAVPYTARPLRDGYLAAHVPGAAHVDVAGELSDPDGTHGFTLPAPAYLARAFEGLGVGDGTHVVVYDTVGSAWATRVWWLLRWLGHDAVSVLDGGLAAWQAAGHAVTTGPADDDAVRAAGAALTPDPREELVARLPEVADVAGGSGTATLVNALDPATFRGEQDVSPYARRGRIPGSANLPLYTLLDPATGRFLPREELVATLQRSGILDADRAVTYCGGGIAATLPAFAAFVAAGAQVAVYDGSLSEWTAAPERPVEVG